MSLESEELKLLVIHLVRDLDTIRAADSRLKQDHFDRNTEVLEYVFWKVSQDCYRKTGGLIPREIFEVQIAAMLKRDLPSHGMAPQVISSSINTIFSYREDALKFPLAADMLERFVLSRSIHEDMQDLMFNRADQSEVIKRMSDALTMSKVSSARPEDGWESEGMFTTMERQPTGCIPVDRIFRDEGLYVGQSIGLLGPMKGGKTSLCHSLACDFICQKSPGGGLNKASYFTYEESSGKQMPKAVISFVNNWHRSEMEGKTLNDMDANVRKAVELAQKNLSQRLALVDMSGSKNGQGQGGVAELVSCMEDLHRNGQLGRLVIVDHMLPMVRTYLASIGRDPSDMRHEISNVCKQFTAACERLGVTGFIAHQMSGKSNEARPHKLMSHLDSAECKMFGELLHDCLVLGQHHKENHVARLNLSASRTMRENDVWVVIAGQRCRVDYTEAYTTDPHDDTRIVTKDHADRQFASDEKTGRTKASRAKSGSATSGSGAMMTAALEDDEDDAPQGSNFKD